MSSSTAPGRSVAWASTCRADSSDLAVKGVDAIAEIVVTKTGTSTVAAVGDEILVQLPENATTGYRWSVERVSGSLEVVSSELALPGAGTGAAPVPGAGGQRLVRLAVVAPGLGAAELVLSRSWETSSLERFEVEVRAQPATS